MEITLDLSPVASLSDEELFALCVANREIRIERDAQGNLILMPPTAGGTGQKNARLTIEVGKWNDEAGAGVVLDSSTGFTLPNGAMRSPDVAWVSAERWARLTEKEISRFPFPGFSGGENRWGYRVVRGRKPRV